jgi:hypothetical protein
VITGDHGSSRQFQADSGAGSERDERSRRSMCPTHMPICRTFTGATGLEPATSGVTGRSRGKGRPPQQASASTTDPFFARKAEARMASRLGLSVSRRRSSLGAATGGSSPKDPVPGSVTARRSWLAAITPRAIRRGAFVAAAFALPIGTWASQHQGAGLVPARLEGAPRPVHCHKACGGKPAVPDLPRHDRRARISPHEEPVSEDRA